MPVMTVDADALLVRGPLTPQAGGVRRFSYNRRVLDLANRVTRGSMYDRNDVALATSNPEEVTAAGGALEALGVRLPAAPGGRRVYPPGRYAAQVIGHGTAYWADSRTVERANAAALRGYQYAEHVIDAGGQPVVSRDYSGLIPAFRGRFDEDGPLQAVLASDRSVRLTLDARLQVAAVQALERNLPVVAGVRRTRAAAIVLDPRTGGILAAASLPTYDPNAVADDLDRMFDPQIKTAYDRARFEIYPPGSTFKLVTAAAALSAASAGGDRAFTCHHTDEIPWTVGHQDHKRRVTDDEAEGPHGQIDLRRALVESCNVYFAWVGTRLGPEVLFNTAHDRFGLALKDIPDQLAFAQYLPDHAYGQARVTVTPLENASVAAAIVNGGARIVPTLERVVADRAMVRREQAVGSEAAASLRDWMIDVVRIGTQVLALPERRSARHLL